MKNNYLLNLKNNRYLDSFNKKIIFTILYTIPIFNRWVKTKLVVSGKMSVDKILEIANHEKVTKIIGYANAAHY